VYHSFLLGETKQTMHGGSPTVLVIALGSWEKPVPLEKETLKVVYGAIALQAAGGNRSLAATRAQHGPF
jgi:hypothetical protein